MMYQEFKDLTQTDISYETYSTVIEPMYMATDLDKREFIKILNLGALAEMKSSVEEEPVEEEKQELDQSSVETSRPRHANYYITETQKIDDNTEVVLGECISGCNYACWYHDIEKDRYYDGAYYGGYGRPKAKEIFDRRVKGETVKTPLTPGDVFDEIIGVLDEKDLLPSDLSDSNGFLDYVLADRKDAYNETFLETPEFFLTGYLNYGCEGIYLDVFLVYNDHGSDKFVKAGTIKTLKDDRDAMYTMAKLQADILMESDKWANEHWKEFESGRR